MLPCTSTPPGWSTDGVIAKPAPAPFVHSRSVMPSASCPNAPEYRTERVSTDTSKARISERTARGTRIRVSRESQAPYTSEVGAMRAIATASPDSIDSKHVRMCAPRPVVRIAASAMRCGRSRSSTRRPPASTTWWGTTSASAAVNAASMRLACDCTESRSQRSIPPFVSLTVKGVSKRCLFVSLLAGYVGGKIATSRPSRGSSTRVNVIATRVVSPISSLIDGDMVLSVVVSRAVAAVHRWPPVSRHAARCWSRCARWARGSARARTWG